MDSPKRDINSEDKRICTEILKSFGLIVEDTDVVWCSLFLRTDDYGVSLSLLNDIDDELKLRTDFRVFGVTRDKNRDNQTIHLSLNMR